MFWVKIRLARTNDDKRKVLLAEQQAIMTQRARLKERAMVVQQLLDNLKD